MQVETKSLGFKYQVGTPLEFEALKDINISIESGKLIAVIGHTGSGKSSFIQHLNGLLIPTSGRIKVGAFEIEAGKKQNLRDLRKNIGVVFQFSEQQLFEETVEKDICFGPMNFGVSEEDAKRQARELVTRVGLEEKVLEKSPFELSGGQMRRVAIAGILAMKPKMLVLDEPTVGLDPKGSLEIMEMFKSTHNEEDLTTFLVTHNMEDVAKYADEVIVFSKGSIAKYGTPEEIFSDESTLYDLGLELPNVVKLQKEFEVRLGIKLSKLHLDLECLAKEIAEKVGISNVR